MTTLITGGAGFIGSQLARSLLAQGESIVVLDNLDPYYDVALKREVTYSAPVSGWKAKPTGEMKACETFSAVPSALRA